VVDVSHEAEPQMRVRVIEDQAVFLSFCYSQSSTDNLHEQDLGLGWSSEDNAAHVPIDACRQTSDVANHANIPVVKLLFNFGSLAGRRIRVNVACRNAGLSELRLQILCVGTIDRKAKRRSVLGTAPPRIYDVGDERSVVHHNRKIALMVIASYGANAG